MYISIIYIIIGSISIRIIKQNKFQDLVIVLYCDYRHIQFLMQRQGNVLVTVRNLKGPTNTNISMIDFCLIQIDFKLVFHTKHRELLVLCNNVSIQVCCPAQPQEIGNNDQCNVPRSHLEYNNIESCQSNDNSSVQHQQHSQHCQ